MSCSKWIAEEIQELLSNSSCEESHVLFKEVAEDTVVEETLLTEEESSCLTEQIHKQL